MKYLKLVRYPNLLMIIFTQILIKYFLFEPFGISITLNAFGFFLLVTATVCLAAAGNIINDIFDVEADHINKPSKVIIGKSISEKTAYNLFFILNIIGVVIGFYLSNMIQKPSFTAIFIFTSALLYLYASSLKSYLVLGNIIISILVAMSLIIVGLFDLFPAITPQNQATQNVIFRIVLDYSIFAFLLNWLREMVKDQQDINGDYKTGIKTLPIMVGKERTNKIIFAVSILPLAAVIYYLYTYLYSHLSSIIYALALIVAPLLYFMIKIITAKTENDYKSLSLLLKVIMFLGLLSSGLFQFILL